MFRRFNCYTIPILLLFVSTFSSASGVSCSYSEIYCYSSIYEVSWCCSDYQSCGDYYGTPCITDSYSTPSSSTDDSSTVVIVFVVIALICCKVFLICCWCAKRIQRQQLISSNSIYSTRSRPVYPYQQQPIRNTGYIQRPPTYNIRPAPSVHHVYEAPPPSYEVATKNISPQQSSVPSAPSPDAASTEEGRFRV